MRIVCTALTLSAIMLGAGVEHATSATFDFRDQNLISNGQYKSKTATVGGIGLTASGGEYVGGSPPAQDYIVDIDSRKVSVGDNGLGVDMKCGFLDFLCPSELDGNALFNDDLLTLTFDKKVRFDSLLFTEVDGGDDFDVFIDGLLIGSEINISEMNPFLMLADYSGFSISIGADAIGFPDEDDFRLGAISVSEVPVPAALPLFATALAGLAGLRLRRRN